jgi:hypothetical protein
MNNSSNFEDASEIDDQDILDILDELHDNSDLESSLLQASIRLNVSFYLLLKQLN